VDQLWWDTARAGGIVAWSLLAGSVLFGLAMSTRTMPGRVRPNWMLDVHRFLGGLAVAFIGVHVTGLLLDQFVHFGPTAVLVPFASSWHPVAVAWGIVAMYLLVAVELTSLGRSRLSRRTWRVVHTLSFPTFVLATVHGLTAGTDRTNVVWQVALWSTAAAVAFLTVVRLLQLGERAPERAPPPTTLAPWPPPPGATAPVGPPIVREIR
jgi:DMSO/TMAO reductase YedYZ heme-binding membrane subunit